MWRRAPNAHRKAAGGHAAGPSRQWCWETCDVSFKLHAAAGVKQADSSLELSLQSVELCASQLRQSAVKFQVLSMNHMGPAGRWWPGRRVAALPQVHGLQLVAAVGARGSGGANFRAPRGHCSAVAGAHPAAGAAADRQADAAAAAAAVAGGAAGSAAAAAAAAGGVSAARDGGGAAALRSGGAAAGAAVAAARPAVVTR